MTSVVGICNLAMSHLSRRAEITAISPPDGTKEAALCQIFYPVARDFILSQREWIFAKTRVALADLGSPPGDWQYRYGPLPADYLRAIALYVTGEDPSLNPGGHPYKIEWDATAGYPVLFANIETAELHYIFRQEVTGYYDANCVLAMSWYLASLLAGPLTQDKNKGALCEQKALYYLGEAGQINANQEKAQSKQVRDLRYPVATPRGSA